MLELNLTKNENSEVGIQGRHYPRVEYKQQMDVAAMAAHMHQHGTLFSEGTIVGILTDFVRCAREQVLQGNTVKIGNLCILKASVDGNGLLLQQGAKVTAGIGAGLPKEIPAGTNIQEVSQFAVSGVKLLAQATGDFTREELKKDAGFRFTRAAKNIIKSLTGNDDGSTTNDTNGTNGGGAGGSDNTGGSTGGNDSGGSGEGTGTGLDE